MKRAFAPPAGMTRRHFLSHLAAAGAVTGPALGFVSALRAGAPDLARRNKAAILLWLGGGPSTIDMWDLKPGASTGGPFAPIATSGNEQISEHLPLLAQQMHHLAIVRSMSTREADHNRGRYYMHTGYVPNPNIEHPSYGAVISHELADRTAGLEIPPFISVGGPSEGPGFLGMAYAPFVVDSNGNVNNLTAAQPPSRIAQRMEMLRLIESDFIRQGRGQAGRDHAKILDKTVSLMTSQQMAAFRVAEEPDAVRERYGNTGFGRGCLMARRLVETGAPFVEVSLGGWDNHSDVFTTLADTRLPELDQGMSALVEDLAQRERLADTAIICMGEFGRTPRVNANVGRDHWARSWSAVVGGAGMPGGIAVGETNAQGTRVESQPYSSEDLMATVLQALGIGLTKTYTSGNGRPMKIAGGGTPIAELTA